MSVRVWGVLLCSSWLQLSLLFPRILCQRRPKVLVPIGLHRVSLSMCVSACVCVRVCMHICVCVRVCVCWHACLHTTPACPCINGLHTASIQGACSKVLLLLALHCSISSTSDCGHCWSWSYLTAWHVFNSCRRYAANYCMCLFMCVLL